MVRYLFLWFILPIFACVATIKSNSPLRTGATFAKYHYLTSIKDTIFLYPNIQYGPQTALNYRLEGNKGGSVEDNGQFFIFFAFDTGNYKLILESRSSGSLQKETLTVAVSNNPPTIEKSNVEIGQLITTINTPFATNRKITDDGTHLKIDVDWFADGTIDSSFMLKGSELILQYSRPTADGVIEEYIDCIVTVTDNDKNSVKDTFSVLLYYYPPFAKLQDNTIECALTPVPISAVKSHDVNAGGRIVSYEWDIGNNGVIDTISTKPVLEWLFNSSGDYEIGLRVVDNDGNRSKKTSTFISVIRDKPEITVKGNHEAIVGRPFLLMGAAKSGCAPIDIYLWDMDGDGKYDYRSSTVSRITYTYTKQGYCMAKFTVVDLKGDSSSVLWPVTVRK